MNKIFMMSLVFSLSLLCHASETCGIAKKIVLSDGSMRVYFEDGNVVEKTGGVGPKSVTIVTAAMSAKLKLCIGSAPNSYSIEQ